MSGIVLNVGNIKTFKMQYLALQSSEINGCIIKTLQNCMQIYLEGSIQGWTESQRKSIENAFIKAYLKENLVDS